ncbi:methyltransferase domain-containing protein [Gigaspora margarita]|uniref:Methyltransferase domain-containing protein n=1 Tax=Gigaspora margarita TaxID=4874 RepID=A0A8H4A2B4_GIGMA|nr:methyltransferase domain-containing protein [Gigaspora margarita]
MNTNHVDSEQEKESEQLIVKEFKDIKNNEEAHEHVTRRLLALKRGVTTPKAATDFLGSDARESLIPLIQNVLRGILQSMDDSCKECNILDIMPGGGTQVDWFLQQELERTIGKRDNYVHLIEHTQKFLDLYKKSVNQYSHLKLGKDLNKKVKDLYSSQKPFDGKLMDFIICMDLCFLTDCYERNPRSNPSKDIIDFVKFVYGQLKPGGAIFVTYLDLESEFSQVNSEYFKGKDDRVTTERIEEIIKARKELLYNGTIVDHLKQDKNTCPKVESHKLSTFYYAKSLADVAVMSLDGGFLKYDKNKFDFDHLQFVLDKIKNVANGEVRNRGDKRPFGLCKAERGRDPLWRVESLQYACVIRKEII